MKYKKIKYNFVLTFIVINHNIMYRKIDYISVNLVFQI